jgi:small subunit ribosomal protein S15
MSTITAEKKIELIKEFGANEKDTGNVKVQIAILTERIRNLTEHVKENKKDKHSTRGLVILVSQRRRLLNYLTKSDLNGYRKLIKDLGLRK